MASQLLKIAITTFLLVAVLAQIPQNDGTGKYHKQSCCPEGYNVARGIYCVRCNAPKYWDALN
jgi:hypothetical protein